MQRKWGMRRWPKEKVLQQSRTAVVVITSPAESNERGALLSEDVRKKYYSLMWRCCWNMASVINKRLNICSGLWSTIRCNLCSYKWTSCNYFIIWYILFVGPGWRGKGDEGEYASVGNGWKGSLLKMNWSLSKSPTVIIQRLSLPVVDMKGGDALLLWAGNLVLTTAGSWTMLHTKGKEETYELDA